MTEQELYAEVVKLSPKDGDVLIVTIKDSLVVPVVIAQIRKNLVAMAQVNNIRLAGIIVFGAADVNFEFVSPADLKAGGRCPVCGEIGHWKAMALCCTRHGKFAG